MQQTLRGKTLLKISGILMLVGAGLGFISLIILLVNIFTYSFSFSFYLLVTLLLSSSGSVLELIAGISGIKNCGNREKAGACLVLGIILACLAFISCVVSLVVSRIGGIGIVTTLLSLTLPVLYIIGAALNKSSPAEPRPAAAPPVYAPAAAPAPVPADIPREVPAPAAPAPESWNCSCGAEGNTGNFCMSCGSARPAAQEGPICPACGWRPDGDETKARFCQICGAEMRNDME